MPSEFLGGDVGLAINACLFLTGALQYGMRQSAEAENLMCSVERVMEYGDLKCENYTPAIENKVNESMFLLLNITFNKYISNFISNYYLIISFYSRPIFNWNCGVSRCFIEV
jgi:hypothetical protein